VVQLERSNDNKVRLRLLHSPNCWQQVAKGRSLLERQKGKDLLLLLDLVSHSLGLVPAIQVLALLDDSFQRLCQPKLRKIIEGEGMVHWEPAPLHSWLRMAQGYRELKVTGYLATLGRKTLEVLEEERGEDGVYTATIGTHTSQLGKGAHDKKEEKGKDGVNKATIGKGALGEKEEKEALTLSLLLNGCR